MAKTSMFNKQGTEFTHLVTVARDPNGPPATYTHSFPVLGKGGRVEERWSTKVRPIKDMTRVLSGARLKRNQDYMVDYNGKEYEYWFLDAKWAMMFQIAASGLTQTLVSKNHKFDIECPHCHNNFTTEQIIWK